MATLVRVGNHIINVDTVTYFTVTETRIVINFNVPSSMTDSGDSPLWADHLVIEAKDPGFDLLRQYLTRKAE